MWKLSIRFITIFLFVSCSSYNATQIEKNIVSKNSILNYELGIDKNGNYYIPSNRDTAFFNENLFPIYKNEHLHESVISCLYEKAFYGDKKSIKSIVSFYKAGLNLDKYILPYNSLDSYSIRYRGNELFEILLEIGSDVKIHSYMATTTRTGFANKYYEMIKYIDQMPPKEYVDLNYNLAAMDILTAENSLVKEQLFYNKLAKDAYDAGLIELKAFGEE